MQVDQTTVRDLSILEPGEDGTSLFALVDCTRTSLGRSALRARMRHLPVGAELQRTQDAVRHLVASDRAAQTAAASVDPDAVDRYLSLKWQALTKRSRAGRLLERLTLRLRYRDAIRQISLGVDCLHGFLGGLQRVVDSLNGGPALLEEYARQLSDLSNDRLLADARRHAQSRSLTDLLEVDRVARGKARDVIRQALTILADLDALGALARTTREQNWCFPDMVDAGGVLEINDLRHPFLPEGIANDIDVTDRRVLAVTGPNMAGKSTLLKAAGMAVYLAHLGCGVPASRARISRFDALLTSLYVRDSLSNGQSFYLNEVRRIRDLISQLESTERVFAILDEPFKGTNVHDATEATALLLRGLCAQVASTVIIATHLAAAVRSLLQDGLLATGYLGSTNGDTDLAFDYRLRPGVSDQRLGMVLLEREGVAQALASAIRGRAQRSAADPGAGSIPSGA